MKKLDKLENEFLPQVMVDNTEVIFDTLRFLEEQTKELIIANTGQVCKWASVPLSWMQKRIFQKLDNISILVGAIENICLYSQTRNENIPNIFSSCMVLLVAKLKNKIQVLNQLTK